MRRLDSLDDFRRSLKDTHDQCRSLLESAERNGERLEPAERNVLLGAVQGLVGVLTFMGGANEQRFTKLCELALDKLKALNDHINRCVQATTTSCSLTTAAIVQFLSARDSSDGRPRGAPNDGGWDGEYVGAAGAQYSYRPADEYDWELPPPQPRRRPPPWAYGPRMRPRRPYYPADFYRNPFGNYPRPPPGRFRPPYSS